MRVWAVLILMLVALAVPATAQPLPSTEREILVKLEPTERAGKAAGRLVIKPRSVRLEMSGLLPGGVYTVQLVRDGPYEEKPLGPRRLVADPEGVGRFDAALSASERSKWQGLVISYHPWGDPADRRDVKRILRARLPSR